MADCVHAKCEPYISCQFVPGTIEGSDVGICAHCEDSVVFVPGSEPLWIRLNGRVRDKVTCHRSPTNKHWVNR